MNINIRVADIEKGHLFTREDYKNIKKMDRRQMEQFFLDVYTTGYKKGAESVKSVRFCELKKILSETKGIGEKRLEEIVNKLKERLGSEFDFE